MPKHFYKSDFFFLLEASVPLYKQISTDDTLKVLLLCNDLYLFPHGVKQIHTFMNFYLQE